MSQRGPQLSRQVRAQEKAWITQFVLTHVVPAPGTNIPVRELFVHYKTYLSERSLTSQLHLDGFGKLLPTSLKREVVYFAEIRKMTPRPNGKGKLETGTALKAAVGVRLV